MIDLRSDTVTKPSSSMRAAIASAEVGDDVYGEDPTVVRLQAEAAAVLGKEAALFVPSGTMGNLISVLAHCARGEEVIVGDEAHVFYYEAAGASAFGGVQMRTVPNRRGAMRPSDIEAAIRSPNIHFPRTALVCLENTHNRGGGRAISLEESRAMAEVAHHYGVAVHLDGSRIFNAATALDCSAATLASVADSVNICFSKGLGAPIGSAVAGSAPFIERCRKYRKMAGGGMRQVGVIAAAALVALHEGPRRLEVDHDNAKIFCDALGVTSTIETDPDAVQTNIVVFRCRSSSLEPEALLEKWREAGVLVNHMGNGDFRAVTHKDVSRDDVIEAARRLQSV
ncbi:MAG: low-specificity L-threonine aldolase [Candidatus Eremiobacteraeota bacterium]|nr:low-specificity L-threonine aldolase [Candidatus Eremiobacteraeota bacterium]MBC5827075.1 low-specificity L-threonine aldolase [Candidatus Eremiobacteraeota bacterium]